ncbi:MAG: hypothetical protein V1663_04060 [archaeon]
MIIEKEDRNFLILISIFILTLLLTFIFFYPKFDIEKEDIVYKGNLSIQDTKDLILNNIQEGDIVLNKPKSFSSYYNYIETREDLLLKNQIFFFFYYNLFDNILIKSMGNEGYWHTNLYIGNGTLNSLFILGIEQDNIDESFIKGNYIKILRVNTPKEIKSKAIKSADQHLRSQDIYYSLKNGLIIVFARSINLNYIFDIEDKQLVCSSYTALLYKDISFNQKKHYTYITPADIEDSNIVKIILVTKDDGVYYGR